MKKHVGFYRKQGTHNGVRYDVHARTQKELREKIKKKIEEIDSGIVNSDITVSSWADRWFASYIQPRLEEKQAGDKRGMLNNYILPAVGRMRMKDVRSVHLQAVLNDLHCSESYGRKIMQTMQQLFRAARKNRIIADDPSEFLQLPALTKERRRRAITAKERALLTATALSHRGGCWVMLQLLCGLRPSEAAAIQKADLAGDMIHVCKAVNRNTGEIKSTKTASGVRDVPITNDMRKFLDEWKYYDRLKPFDYIATTQQGEIMRDGAQRSMWRSIKRDMDIRNGAILYRNAIVTSTLAEDFTPYCLRHTYCTDLQAAGVPINVAKELMGHSDISVTSRIYTHSSTEATQNAAVKLNALSRERNRNELKEGSREGSTCV